MPPPPPGSAVDTGGVYGARHSTHRPLAALRRRFADPHGGLARLRPVRRAPGGRHPCLVDRGGVLVRAELRVRVAGAGHGERGGSGVDRRGPCERGVCVAGVAACGRACKGVDPKGGEDGGSRASTGELHPRCCRGWSSAEVYFEGGCAAAMPTIMC